MLHVESGGFGTSQDGKQENHTSTTWTQLNITLIDVSGHIYYAPT